MSTKIQWTDETWNPIIGCSKISPGCVNCYAETMAIRLSKIKTTSYYSKVVQNDKDHPFHHLGWYGRTEQIFSQMHKPIRLKKPRKIFVCSMGDLFHEKTSFDEIDEVFAIMAICEQHTFQVLTKRPERMKQYFDEKRDWRVGQLMIMFSDTNYDLPAWPLNNVWLGVTAENQWQATLRIPILLEIPSVVKFVSVEPMLEYISLAIFLPKLDWVICGGESGNKARPMHPDWVSDLRDQCEASNVPFFFKQWGEWMPVFNLNTNIHPAELKCKHSWVNKLDGKDTGDGEGMMVLKLGKNKTGCILDGKEYKQFPKNYNHEQNER